LPWTESVNQRVQLMRHPKVKQALDQVRNKELV